MAYNDELSGAIVLDLETVASPDAEAFLDPIKAPGNYKDEAKIAAYKAEKLVEVVGKAALEPDLCEVVAVGWQLDEETHAFTREDLGEASLIQKLWNAVGQRRVIGFNALGFDLPVLIRRSQLLGLSYPNLNLDRYRTPHLDLLERLSFNGKLTYRSLSFYCRRFGVQIEDAVNGADIAGLVAAEDWTAVAAHVRADVEKTAALATRLGWLAPIAEAVV